MANLAFSFERTLAYLLVAGFSVSGLSASLVGCSDDGGETASGDASGGSTSEQESGSGGAAGAAGGSGAENMLAATCAAACDDAKAECTGDPKDAEPVADLCKIFCAAFVDTPDCRAKFETLRTCTRMHEILCTTLDHEDPATCAEEGSPFAFDASAPENAGECLLLEN